MGAIEREKTLRRILTVRVGADIRHDLQTTLGPESREGKNGYSSDGRVYLKDYRTIFGATAKSLNLRGLTDISIEEDENQTSNGQPLDKEKIRLIIQDRKQSGYLDRFFTIAFDAVLARSMMREEKISEEEQVERLQKLIDERTLSLQLSVGNDNRGRKTRPHTVFWKKRKNYVSK